MGSAFRTPGIEVAVHSNEHGCGNPCPPPSTCSCCAPFWEDLRASRQFDAKGAFTFNGGTSHHCPTVSAENCAFEFPSYRHRGLNR
jgi:hypothetical protein